MVLGMVLSGVTASLVHVWPGNSRECGQDVANSDLPESDLTLSSLLSIACFSFVELSCECTFVLRGMIGSSGFL